MGKKKPAHRTPDERPSSLADALFSKAQQRVLGVLFGNPDRSFFASEVIALAGTGTGAVQRELAKLAATGLVTVKRMGRQKHYQANPAAPVFAELRGLVVKTSGVADVVRAGLSPLRDRIHAAFIYGSIAKSEYTAASDVDLMVVSDELTYGEVFGALEETAKTLERQVSPTVYTRRDMRKRLKEKNAFITRVLAQPRIWLVGDEHALRT